MMHYPSNAMLPNPNLPSVSSIASIFKFQRLKPSNKAVIPKLDENHPLSLYYYAEEHLDHAIKQLEKVKNINSRRFPRGTDRVHQAQKLLLDTIFLVYAHLDNELKIPKPHRSTLPAEDLAELSRGFSENILFAAQAIVHGFHIRGIEHCSDLLREPALQLCATLDALRHKFRAHTLTKPELPFNYLNPVLVDFDFAWTNFEQAICQSYFSALRDSEDRQRPTNYNLFIEQLKLTLNSEVTNGILDRSWVEDLDPSLFFALPRLTLLNCLLDSHSPLIGDECFIWFQSHQSILKALLIVIPTLDANDLQLLREWLANFTPPIKLTCKQHSKLMPIFTQLCSVTDTLQSGDFSAPFLKALQQVLNSTNSSQ